MKFLFLKDDGKFNRYTNFEKCLTTKKYFMKSKNGVLCLNKRNLSLHLQIFLFFV